MWGNNQSGQIGNNTNIEQVFPQDITSHFDLFDGERIKDVELGNLNTAILTTDNRLFIWGDNTYGQIGNNTYTNSSIPIDITPFFEFTNSEYIKDLSLGTVHTAALTSQGNIYTWGFNDNGLLGNQSIETITKPTSIMEYITLDSNENITNISLGGAHSVFLTSSNNLYIWGTNLYGELGNNTTDNLNSPNQVNDFIPLEEGDTIKFVSLGIGNTFIVTTQGKVYASGYNEHGQLGINSMTNALTPTKVYLFNIELIHTEEYNIKEDLTLYNPTRNQYEIKQWYIDKELSSAFNSEHLPNGEMNLYAHWHFINE